MVPTTLLLFVLCVYSVLSDYQEPLVPVEGITNNILVRSGSSSDCVHLAQIDQDMNLYDISEFISEYQTPTGHSFFILGKYSSVCFDLKSESINDLPNESSKSSFCKHVKGVNQVSAVFSHELEQHVPEYFTSTESKWGLAMDRVMDRSSRALSIEKDQVLEDLPKRLQTDNVYQALKCAPIMTSFIRKSYRGFKEYAHHTPSDISSYRVLQRARSPAVCGKLALLQLSHWGSVVTRPLSPSNQDIDWNYCWNINEMENVNVFDFSECFWISLQRICAMSSLCCSEDIHQKCLSDFESEECAEIRLLPTLERPPISLFQVLTHMILY